MRKFTLRVLWLFMLALVISAGSAALSERVLVVAGSDFQDPATSYTTSSDYAKNGDYTEQTARLKRIMNVIFANCGDAYAFIGGGDYGFNDMESSTTKTQKGVNAIKTAVTDVFGSDTLTLLIQGNHDAPVSGLSSTGAHDTEYFGAYIIREDDYAAQSTGDSAKRKVKSTADALEAYLAEKVDSDWNRPVFIATHVPLHFSTRTVSKGDGIYARYLYDVLYKYGDRLNIFFLFGHNHAWGDDDYLGGSSVFFTNGDTVNIAQLGSKSEFSAEPLNFTYMNYGYTGYFWSKWATMTKDIRYSNADSTLTMTSFLIDGNTVTVSRWSENGIHDLKSVGKSSQGYRGVSEVCPVTSGTYSSPQIISKEISSMSIGITAEDAEDRRISVRVSGSDGASALEGAYIFEITDADGNVSANENTPVFDGALFMYGGDTLRVFGMPTDNYTITASAEGMNGGSAMVDEIAAETVFDVKTGMLSLNSVPCASGKSIAIELTNTFAELPEIEISIDSLTLPAGTALIDAEAFEGCGSANRIILPKDLTFIGNMAFADCAKLMLCDMTDTECAKLTAGENPFPNNDRLLIFVSEGMAEAAKGAIPDSADCIFEDDDGILPTWYRADEGWMYIADANDAGSYVTGLIKDIPNAKGAAYCFTNRGIMRTEWARIGGKWYYFGTDGAMRTGIQTIGGRDYVFNSDGTLESVN